MSPFEIYLRTGRIAPDPDGLERKFNPWHDEDDGRFTFAGQGRYFAGGGGGGGGSGRGSTRNASAKPSTRGRGGSFGGGGAGGSWTSPTFRRFDPRNPANHSIYKVRRGDNLTSIAARRHGLSVSDLAWLNGIRANDALQAGQRLKLPHQSYLDAGRAAKNNLRALAGAARPSTEPADKHITINKNGYRYDIDNGATRTIEVRAELILKPQPRSKREQQNAGKPDRRSTDDGGHFIAARFNGPRDWFNHFAQDASFNRGAYRVIEDSWAKDVRAGKKVFVDIIPHYHDASRRPYELTVIWYVDGRPSLQEFANEPGGKKIGQR